MLGWLCWLSAVLGFVAWISQLSKPMVLIALCLCLSSRDPRGSLVVVVGLSTTYLDHPVASGCSKYPKGSWFHCPACDDCDSQAASRPWRMLVL